MAMNSPPLDSSFQCASFEPKILNRFFRFREIRKKTKNRIKPKNPYFWLPQQKMGSIAGTFTIPEFN
jgi:hypothetical protein